MTGNFLGDQLEIGTLPPVSSAMISFRRRRSAALRCLARLENLFVPTYVFETDVSNVGARLHYLVLKRAGLLLINHVDYPCCNLRFNVELRRVAESLLLDAAAIDWENEEP